VNNERRHRQEIENGLITRDEELDHTSKFVNSVVWHLLSWHLWCSILLHDCGPCCLLANLVNFNWQAFAILM